MSVGSYLNPSGTSFTLPQSAVKLHSLMAAATAGWEIQYANAGAIGTGSLANPAWDGVTAAVSTSAGIATYLMPLAGLTNRWAVQIEWRWSSTISQYAIRTTSATAVNTSTGALTNAGRTQGSGVNGNASSESWFVASEHGFLALGTNGFHAIERRRSIAGTVEDTLLTYQFSPAAATNFGFGSTGLMNLSRVFSTGVESSEQFMGVLGGLNGISASSGVDIASMTAPDGTGYPMGPEASADGRGGIVRLLHFWRPNDLPAGVNIQTTMDGSARTYTSGSNNLNAGPGNTRYAVARS